MRVYEQLYELYFLHFSVCLWLLDTQSFHQPAVLLSSNAERFILAARPLELTLFKSLVEQEKAIAFPVERFDSVGSPAAEQEQRVGTWIKFELLFNDSRQTIDPTTKIRVAAGKVDLRSAEIAQHDLSTRNSAASVASSAPLCTSAQMLPTLTDAAMLLLWLSSKDSGTSTN